MGRHSRWTFLELSATQFRTHYGSLRVGYLLLGKKELGMFFVGKEKKKETKKKGKEKRREIGRSLDQKVYSGETVTDCTIFVLIEACT